jgi:hypothetical protein
MVLFGSGIPQPNCSLNPFKSAIASIQEASQQRREDRLRRGHSTGKQGIQRRYEPLDASRIAPLRKLSAAARPNMTKPANAPAAFAATVTACAMPSSTPKVFALLPACFEAGCKVVAGTRPKRCGMHWTGYGANTIGALRCRKIGARFEDFLGTIP